MVSRDGVVAFALFELTPRTFFFRVLLCLTHSFKVSSQMLTHHLWIDEGSGYLLQVEGPQREKSTFLLFYLLGFHFSCHFLFFSAECIASQ